MGDPLAGFSFFGVAMEWLALHMHAYTYLNWNLFYSSVVYLYLQSFLLVFFSFLKSNYYKTKVPYKDEP